MSKWPDFGLDFGDQPGLLGLVAPAQVREEALESYADGYRKMISQMWYFDVFKVNYLALAEFSWNPTSGPADALSTSASLGTH